MAGFFGLLDHRHGLAQYVLVCAGPCCKSPAILGVRCGCLFGQYCFWTRMISCFKDSSWSRLGVTDIFFKIIMMAPFLHFCPTREPPRLSSLSFPAGNHCLPPFDFFRQIRLRTKTSPPTATAWTLGSRTLTKTNMCQCWQLGKERCGDDVLFLVFVGYAKANRPFVGRAPLIFDNVSIRPCLLVYVLGLKGTSLRMTRTHGSLAALRDCF